MNWTTWNRLIFKALLHRMSYSIPVTLMNVCAHHDCEVPVGPCSRERKERQQGRDSRGFCTIRRPDETSTLFGSVFCDGSSYQVCSLMLLSLLCDSATEAKVALNNHNHKVETDDWHVSSTTVTIIRVLDTVTYPNLSTITNTSNTF